jgi:hypothetical protein
MKQIKLKDILPWALLALALWFLWGEFNEKPEIEYVPVEVEVQVPVVEKVFDTIYQPKPIPVKETVIDSTFYEKYVPLKDSVQKDSLFKEAIKINEYETTFEDSVQTIKVYSKTRGKLISQTAEYKTKPFTITVKDSVPIIPKVKAFVGVEAGVPTIPHLATRPVAKANFMLLTKKQNIISVSYDTEGRVWVGKTWKISFRGKN